MLQQNEAPFNAAVAGYGKDTARVLAGLLGYYQKEASNDSWTGNSKTREERKASRDLALTGVRLVLFVRRPLNPAGMRTTLALDPKALRFEALRSLGSSSVGHIFWSLDPPVDTLREKPCTFSSYLRERVWSLGSRI